MTKFADKHCDKLHDKICRQSLSTAADEYLTFWFLCIFLVSATHTKTSRAYIQLTVEGFPFCRSPLQVLARVPASVCIAHTHAITGGRVHAPDRCQEIGRMALRHAGTCRKARARARTQKQVPAPHWTNVPAVLLYYNFAITIQITSPRSHRDEFRCRCRGIHRCAMPRSV